MFEFLKAFEQKPDHPMATVAEAKAILASLAGEQPEAALEQLASFATSVSVADGFACDNRLAVVKEIDGEGRARANAVLAGFFARIHIRDPRQKAAFDLLHSYWNALSGAYARCATDHELGARGAARIRDEMPLAIGRALRAAGQAVRMRYLRYLGVDAQAWAALAKLFASAERLGAAEAVFVPYPHEVRSTVRAELLKILGMSLAALHEVPPEQVELAYRILDRFAASFAWGQQPGPECNFVFDLSANSPPGQAGPPWRSSRRSSD